MQRTKIEWTKIEWTKNGYTWNPTTGCTHVSDGCRFCYAEAISLRFGRSVHPWTAPYEAVNVRLYPERLMQPFAVKDPAFCFVDSMSDLFHRLVPDEFVFKVWAVMLLTPHITYQILTKRPERMRAFLALPDLYGRVLDEANLLRGVRPELGDVAISDPAKHPADNIWLGTSVEDQRVYHRIDDLVGCPARIHFLSCEPLIGELDITDWLPQYDFRPTYEYFRDAYPDLGHQPIKLRDGGVDWVIAGGESGPSHRPLNLDWVRDLRDQCESALVPFFFKQVGGRTPKAGGRLLDGRTWDEMPGVGAAVAS
jgi:protein gp37